MVVQLPFPSASCLGPTNPHRRPPTCRHTWLVSSNTYLRGTLTSSELLVELRASDSQLCRLYPVGPNVFVLFYLVSKVAPLAHTGTHTHSPVVIESSCPLGHIPGSTCQSHYLPPCPRRTLWHTSEQLGQIIGNLAWPCPIIMTANYWRCSERSPSAQWRQRR